METVIRRAEPADVPEIMRLMGDFAAFEKLEQFLTVTPERLDAALFGPDAFVESLVADGPDGKLSAYTLFFPNFSSFRGQRGFYIDDLYIAESGRGRGLGRAMLRAIARLAADRGFERLDLQVLDWNTPAIGFYASLGAVRDDEERHFKFTDKAFAALAAE